MKHSSETLYLKSSFSSHLGKLSTSIFLTFAAHITNSDRNLQLPGLLLQHASREGSGCSRTLIKASDLSASVSLMIPYFPKRSFPTAFPCMFSTACVQHDLTT